MLEVTTKVATEVPMRVCLGIVDTFVVRAARAQLAAPLRTELEALVMATR
jgi:hypothetical protein